MCNQSIKLIIQYFITFKIFVIYNVLKYLYLIYINFDTKEIMTSKYF
jgi:hypothetical protein